MDCKFSLGRTVITPTAQATLDPLDVGIALRRHAAGDWGNCGMEDWKENEFSLHQDEPVKIRGLHHIRVVGCVHDHDSASRISSPAQRLPPSAS